MFIIDVMQMFIIDADARHCTNDDIDTIIRVSSIIWNHDGVLWFAFAGTQACKALLHLLLH